MRDIRAREIGRPTTVPLFDMVVDLHPKQDFGPGPVGRRVLFGSAGGTFEGARVRGTVLPGGGDWTLFRSTGVMTLDVRLSLRTDDGELFLMTYGGRYKYPPELAERMADTSSRHRVDPSEYYFRTNPLFETGSSTYGWLNDTVCIGKGYLVEGGIAYSIFEVE